MKNVRWLALLFLLGGCAHQGTKPTGSAATFPQSQFWEDQQVREKEAGQIVAKVRVAYQGRKRKVAGEGRLLLQPQDRLRLELRDPFGRVHYLAVLDGDAFVAHYPRQRLAYTDAKAGHAYVNDFLGMDFSFYELHSLMLGVIPKRFGTSFEGWHWDESTKSYRGVLARGDQRVTAWVDPSNAALRRMELGSPAGKVLAEYSSFGPCCQGVKDSRAWIAQVVDLKLERAKTSLSVEWEKIDRLEEARPADVFRVELSDKDQKIVLK